MRGRRTNLIAVAVLAIVACLAVTAGLVHSHRPERLRVSFTPAPSSASTTTTTSTTTTEPPVTTTTLATPQTAAGAATEQPAVRDDSSQPPAPAVSPPDTNDPCANPIIPESIAMRESGCRWDAYNPGGCSGRGCIGFYQLDEGHFAAVSPWNSNVAGVCHDLQAVEWEPWAQTECASRLGPGAWN